MKKTKKFNYKKYKQILVRLIVVMLWVFVIFYGSYVYGYSNAIKNMQSVEKVNLDKYSIENNTHGLFNKTIDSFTVYSDVNNFTKIQKILDKLNLYPFDYIKLTGIIYYQNLGDEHTGYYEHLESISCDGNFDIYGRFITLYRCDGTFRVRNLTLTENNSEEGILLHELAHYDEYYNNKFQEDIADQFAMQNLK